ncbi:MAG: hypothetical protein K0B87_03370 [Candidatus Syntrophosphaera sp.]|nr:hypothetical protein [Candidatus Syntrophosphaera sp.]
MKYTVAALMALWAGLIWSQTIGDWQNIRFSGVNAESQVLLRTEIGAADLVQNKVIYNPGSGIAEYNLTLQNAATSTYQATLPAGTPRRYLGLKKQALNDNILTIPVYHTGTALPSLSQLTKASDDAPNDQATAYLDIIADYVSFSDSMLYTGIQNRGGGFPTYIGLDVFSYMSVIADPLADPDDPDVIVWALNYINIPIVGMSPGLYKITGTGIEDLVRLADVSYQLVAESDLVIMGCNLADLLADPDFAAWFDPADPVMGFQTLVSMTNLSTSITNIKDQSPGAGLFLHPLFFDSSPNTTPLLGNATFQSAGGEVFFSAEYSDAEGNFPLTAQIELQDGSFYDLLPQSFDYSGSLPHRTDDLTGILDEYPSGLARTVVSDDNINFNRSEWFSFIHILGILWPDDVNVQIANGTVYLSWDPVTSTILGNPVTPDFYRVEASLAPDFASFEVIASTAGTNFSFPANPGQSRSFYRIIAVKAMP